MEFKVKQRSDEWFKLREKVALTASRFGDALGVGRGKPFDFFVHLTSGNCDEDEDEETNEAMHYGIKMEVVIQEAYQLLTGNKTRESGFWEPRQQDMLKGLVGASPDAIICNRNNLQQNVAVCEFKAPAYRMYGGDTCRHQIPRKYMAQIQGQMAVTGLNFCDFMAVCTKTREIILKRVYFNSTYWIHASAALHAFCLAVKEAKHRKKINQNPTDFEGSRKLQALPYQHSLLPGEGLTRVENLLKTNEKGEFHGPSRLWLSYDFLMGTTYTIPPTLKSYSNSLIQSIDRTIRDKKMKQNRPAPYPYAHNQRRRYAYNW